MAETLEQKIAQLQQAITVQESMRSMLGEAIVNTTIAALRKQLAELEGQAAPQAHMPPPAGASAPGQQRKLASVLFADIAGFTALSETLDAEDVTDIMNDLWQQIDAAITNHGGWIDKHIGDAVMALWGVEQSHEDDPEHALHAALAMQNALADFRQQRQVQLSMRIGVNTGPVLLGEVGSRHEFTAMGDAVNLASRLEHAAPVGGILTSHNTYLHVRSLFDMQALDPIQVKGKKEPVQVYLVKQARQRSFHKDTRGVKDIAGGHRPRMIGRDAELGGLQNAFAAACAGKRQVVTVTGDAGVGKSRLLSEFDLWMETQPPAAIFRGRADEFIQHTPYSLLRDLLTASCQMLDSDAPAWCARKSSGASRPPTPAQRRSNRVPRCTPIG